MTRFLTFRQALGQWVRGRARSIGCVRWETYSDSSSSRPAGMANPAADSEASEISPG
jgi:hypothetical protein